MIIKVCGVTRPGDAEMAVEAGATALGFNFWMKSPRYLDPNKADWIRDVKTLRVGVFVDAEVREVVEIATRTGLDVVQIHRGSAPDGWRYWKAIAIGEAVPEGAEAVVVDAPPLEGQPGGTGQSYDWRRAAGLPGKVIVAGGLDGANVAEAIRQARPYGVDAASRLESAPGIKDRGRVTAFVQAARRAFEETRES